MQRSRIHTSNDDAQQPDAKDKLKEVFAAAKVPAEEERSTPLGISKERRLPAVMYTERAEAVRIISARRATRAEIMKRSRSKVVSADRVDANEILPEYNFRGSSSNKFASRYAAGSAVIVLDPDVAAAFPSSGEANEALRALAGIIQKHRHRRPVSRRSL